MFAGIRRQRVIAFFAPARVAAGACEERVALHRLDDAVGLDALPNAASGWRFAPVYAECVCGVKVRAVRSGVVDGGGTSAPRIVFGVALQTMVHGPRIWVILTPSLTTYICIVRIVAAVMALGRRKRWQRRR